MKKVSVAKIIESFRFEVNDEKTRNECIGHILINHPEYTIQCDELNNGPAELNANQLVVDVWEEEGGRKYTRFVLGPNKKVEHHDKP